MEGRIIFFFKILNNILHCFCGGSRVCRFYPTCSIYMNESIQKYGVFRGLGLGLWRLLRCGPWSTGGYDRCFLE